MTRTLFPIALLAVLSGCAGMSETECRAANWYQVGEREALIYGIRPQYDQHAHACSRFGVQVPEAEYMTGWMDGQGERLRRAAGEGCCAPD